jgi:predicted negative regulator of RcsB-dependent stress response
VPSNLTRKELKQDNVALNVEKSFDFVNAHRQSAVRIAGAVLALIVVVAAIFYYRSSQQTVREQMLGDAIALQNAPVGAAPPNGGPSFPTEAAKKGAVTTAFQKIVSGYGGSTEAYIAEYSQAQMDIDSGKPEEARKKYQDVADHADVNYASLGKLALAQLDFADNRTADAQNLLKNLQDHPTDLVSKNQATFALAKGLIPTQPDEARKLLLSLATTQSDISQIAVAAMTDLPTK